MRIIVIAKNTFLETIRDRVLWVIVGLCLVVILASRAIAEISLGQDLKVIADLSLGAIDFFGMILCVFVGTSLIYKEMDKRTLYTVLACPLDRWEFIVGKYLGMGATLTVSVVLMGIVFLAFFLVTGGIFHWKMAGAVLLLLMGMMLLNAIAVFFSTMSSPTVSAISTVAIFVVGRATYELQFLAERFIGIKKSLILFFYYLLPNFNNFNIKLAAVYDLAVPWNVWVWAFCYAAVYSLVVLYLSSLIFAKRNL